MARPVPLARRFCRFRAKGGDLPHREAGRVASEDAARRLHEGSHDTRRVRTPDDRGGWQNAAGHLLVQHVARRAWRIREPGLRDVLHNADNPLATGTEARTTVQAYDNRRRTTTRGVVKIARARAGRYRHGKERA